MGECVYVGDVKMQRFCHSIGDIITDFQYITSGLSILMQIIILLTDTPS